MANEQPDELELISAWLDAHGWDELDSPAFNAWLVGVGIDRAGEPQGDGWQPIETAPERHRLPVFDPQHGQLFAVKYNGRWMTDSGFGVNPTFYYHMPAPPARGGQ